MLTSLALIWVNGNRNRHSPCRARELGMIAIMPPIGKSQRAVWRWQDHFLKECVNGLLHDKPRPGRPPTVTPNKVRKVVGTILGETTSDASHWSTCTLARAVGLGTDQGTQDAVSHPWTSRRLANILARGTGPQDRGGTLRPKSPSKGYASASGEPGAASGPSTSRARSRCSATSSRPSSTACLKAASVRLSRRERPSATAEPPWIDKPGTLLPAEGRTGVRLIMGDLRNKPGRRSSASSGGC
jgi:hypothetical protein